MAPCGRRVFNNGQGLQFCASCDSFHVYLQSHIQLGMRESCFTAPSPGAIFITLMLFFHCFSSSIFQSTEHSFCSIPFKSAAHLCSQSLLCFLFLAPSTFFIARCILKFPSVQCSIAECTGQAAGGLLCFLCSCFLSKFSHPTKRGAERSTQHCFYVGQPLPESLSQTGSFCRTEWSSCSQKHRIIEWLVLEGTSKTI